MQPAGRAEAGPRLAPYRGSAPVRRPFAYPRETAAANPATEGIAWRIDRSMEARTAAICADDAQSGKAQVAAIVGQSSGPTEPLLLSACDISPHHRQPAAVLWR